MSLAFPNVDQIAFELGPLAVRWYSLAYIFGIILGISYVRYLSGKFFHKLEDSLTDDLFIYIILSIIICGRLGYVIFYNPEFYFTHPLDILKTYQGGMSFHGGLIGAIWAVWFVAKRHKENFYLLLDLAACAAPIGLFFGRIANFVNAELYGRTTTVSWGIIFPGAGPYPRHPSQLYEAFAEGLGIFIISNILLRLTNINKPHGTIFGTALMLYGFFRFIIENFREPDAHLGFVILQFSMGQLLCMPMIMIGIIVVLRANRQQLHQR